MAETPPPPGEAGAPDEFAPTPTKILSPSHMTPEQREADRLAAEKLLADMSARFKAEKDILFTVSLFGLNFNSSLIQT